MYFLHILIHIRITGTTYTFLPIKNTHIEQNISYTRISLRATITGPQLSLIHAHPEIFFSFDIHSPPEMRPIRTRSHQETHHHTCLGIHNSVVSRCCRAMGGLALVHLLPKSCHPDAYSFSLPSLLESHILSPSLLPLFWGSDSLFSRLSLPQIEKARGLRPANKPVILSNNQHPEAQNSL